MPINHPPPHCGNTFPLMTKEPLTHALIGHAMKKWKKWKKWES
jgi:hypothetical protein